MNRARATGRDHGRDTGHGDVGASFVLIFPLLLIYEIGVLFTGHVSSADLVTRVMFAIAGSRTAYLAIHAAIALGFLLWIRHTRRWGTLRLEHAAPVILEAALYALTLGAVVSLVLDRLIDPVLDPLLDPLLRPLFGRLLAIGTSVSSVISAIGAGIHEELVFRLGVIATLLALARQLGWPRGPRMVVALAIAVSALMFAAAHHLGAHGEPWTIHAFVFRALAGVAFGAMFWFRSLAHAVYAHALYDVLVVATR